MRLSKLTGMCWAAFFFSTIIPFILFSSPKKAIALLVFAYVVFLIQFKIGTTKGIACESQFFLSQPEEFSQLDSEQLTQYTTELETLGFTKIFDCKLQRNVEFSNSVFVFIFGRIFTHPQLHCFAAIDQMFSSGEAQSRMERSIVSDLADNWILSNSTRKIASIWYVARRPRVLWIFCPDSTPQEILESHIEKRQEMIDVLGVQPQKDFSWDFFVEREEKSRIETKRVWKRKNLILGLIEATLFELNPPSEWMGDYKRIAKRKARMQ
ncbi:hypothetical protein IQ249_10275 [Lusitaniella coriacea LEGE 07157]|uniref:Uncharacterized protein n=1 Tax=Lusitaniella coriacea LEGE 07157 TaxID=945747 RepID=A0A8J7ISN2_9CYAN|nr:hypothetical protein [Lusitaniella coriacea]MBE9116282.1 hypothetical protein [Lusitaniella coriacea LEGE 07157]